MTREVRGLGTLVPEETLLIPATTAGRVARILIRPGTPVKADSVVMVLTSPELETDTLNAEYAMKAAEADLENLKVTLAKAKIDMQGTIGTVRGDLNTAKLQADRDAALAKGRSVQRDRFQDLRREGARTAEQTNPGRAAPEHQHASGRSAVGGPAGESGTVARSVRVEEEPGGPAER
jgi:multidrug resistance efflux pump